MTILVTGGAGYIGSHFIRLLENKKKDFVIVDNLSTGHQKFIKNKEFINADLKDKENLKKLLNDYNFSSIVHFAGLSIVKDSQSLPENYYENNVIGSKNIVEIALEKNIRHFVFSSSAAVYGNPEEERIKESHPTKPINNYGKNKLQVENLLKQVSQEYPLDVVCLRYFNAAGADKKGDLGELRDPETHLIPNIIKKAINKDTLEVFGKNFKTPDGTCIRDYIHVSDLAEAHAKALEFLTENKGFHVFNLGNERGFSNLEIINTAQEVLKLKIDYKIQEPREGDPAKLIADSTRAKNLLKWTQSKTEIKEMILSAYQFYQNEKI